MAAVALFQVAAVAVSQVLVGGLVGVVGLVGGAVGDVGPVGGAVGAVDLVAYRGAPNLHNL